MLNKYKKRWNLLISYLLEEQDLLIETIEDINKNEKNNPHLERRKAELLEVQMILRAVNKIIEEN